MADSVHQEGNFAQGDIAGGDIYKTIHYDAPEHDLGIIREIFEFVDEKIVALASDKGPRESIDFTAIKQKIELNFKGESLQTVMTSMKNLYGRTGLVRRFVEEEGSEKEERVLALVDMVQGRFRQVVGCEDNHARVGTAAILDGMAESLLPQSKRSSPEYLAVAKAILLYLFELCYFGKKDSDGSQINDSLFGNE